MEHVLQTINSVLGATAERWMALAQSMPIEMLAQRPAQEEWSAVECLQHIVDTEKVLQFRLQAFMQGHDFPGFDPNEEGTKPGAATPLAMAEEFARLRRVSLETLEKLKPADLERKARHAELGEVTLNQMVHEWVAHDLNHTMQAERALMQPFIHDCGPWQIFFTNHIMKE